MSDDGDENSLLHVIIEDAICDECDEPAMPYDDNVDYPYCPVHQLELWTGMALEDYTNVNPASVIRDHLRRLTNRPISDQQECYGMPCHMRGVSRLSRPGYANATFSACVEHARSIWIPAQLSSLATWTTELRDDFDYTDL